MNAISENIILAKKLLVQLEAITACPANLDQFAASKVVFELKKATTAIDLAFMSL